MRALNPLFPKFGWTSTGEYASDNLVEDNHSNCTFLENQTSLGVSESSEVNGINNNSVVMKKLIHNANERGRRKKTNSLFSSLRSCLPGPDEPKLSIPQIISRSVQYIPELKEQVKRLTQKKEDLLLRVPGQRERYVMPQPKVVSSHVSNVFTTELRDSEVMAQISSSKIHNFSIYNVLSGLEEDGFVVVHVSSSSSRGGERLFYTLHLQVDKTDDYKPICVELSQRILYLFEECGNSFK